MITDNITTHRLRLGYIYIPANDACMRMDHLLASACKNLQSVFTNILNETNFQSTLKTASQIEPPSQFTHVLPSEIGLTSCFSPALPNYCMEEPTASPLPI